MITVEFGKKVEGKLCLALGYFDGVHIGHRKVFENVFECALKAGLVRAVSTFADKPNKSDSVMSYADRKQLFSQLGMEVCISLFFIRDGHKKGREFFEELTTVYDIVEIVCGEDYKFGCDFCDVTVLDALCREKGIALNVVPLYNLDGVRVSSTAIKILLKSGKLAAANKMLVTPYHITGRVVSGQGIGRNIGMPTVNINPPEGIIPLRHGVYASIVEIDGKQYAAVTNYGGKPTFGRSACTVESHLIDYDGGSLLSRDITVYFVNFIRLIRKFKTADELVAQINKDMQKVTKCLE